MREFVIIDVSSPHSLNEPLDTHLKVILGPEHFKLPIPRSNVLITLGAMARASALQLLTPPPIGARNFYPLKKLSRPTPVDR